jgi:thiamine-phosphate pyrophosphorylase
LKFTFPKIYPITDEHISGLSHSEQVERLIAGGATLIQLREKCSTARVFYEAAAKAVEIARTHNVNIVINDRVDIALALKAGVHLGQDDLPPERARDILGPDAIIGYSTHSAEQAVRAMTLPVDYIAIGPIFQTRTKSNPDPTIGLDGLRHVRSVVDKIPLVAIGGIDESNVISVLDSGADSAAIIGAIISDPEKITHTMTGFIKLTTSS